MTEPQQTKIILGSASAGRKAVLEKMGCAFDVMRPEIDEKAIRAEDPEELTLLLARAKADALLPNIKEPAILITSDQVGVCNGKVLEKPETEGEARAFFNMYAKHPAKTITAVVVTNTQTGERAEGVDIAKIYFRPIPKKNNRRIHKNRRRFSAVGRICARTSAFEKIR